MVEERKKKETFAKLKSEKVKHLQKIGNGRDGVVSSYTGKMSVEGGS